jgi:hypothetical protein
MSNTGENVRKRRIAAKAGQIGVAAFLFSRRALA